MFRPSLLAASIALLFAPLFALAPSGAAFACGFAGAGEGGCPTCAPPPCQTCNLPTTHQIVIPGVTVSPPSITVGSPTLGCDTCNFNGGGGFGSVNVTVNINQTAEAVAQGSSNAQALGLSNAAAANLILGGGGGGGFVDSGPSTSITNLTVVNNEAPATRQVCVAQKAVFALYAVQAVCLDDKATPHPASQTNADRDVADTFRGELYRCIAGSHMQYTVSAYAGGAANFDHGQTKVCAKNDALWREASGAIVCRPQTPARDCNERSLLRRYGAGVKVLKMAGAEVCAAWRTETVAAASESVSGGQSFAGNGGVGW